MKTVPRGRRFSAWLALVGLVLQIGLVTAHSARHFDHLIGEPNAANTAIAAGEPNRGPGAPSPAGPAPLDRDQCPIDLGLAAAGNGVLAAPERILVLLSFEIARLDDASSAIAPAARRHPLPPARAPPVIEIIA